MKAPKCKICGDEHWGLCPKFQAPDKRHSEGEPRIKPKPVGQAGSPANPEAKASKANPRDDAPVASEADGDASRLSAGRTAQGAPAKAARAALKKAETESAHLAPALTTRGTPRKRAPKGTVDRKAYQAEKARKRRARKRAEKQQKEG